MSNKNIVWSEDAVMLTETKFWGFGLYGTCYCVMNGLNYLEQSQVHISVACKACALCKKRALLNSNI